MRLFNLSRLWMLAVLIAVAVLASACRAETAPPLPTRTPPPTFTPEPEVVLTPVDPSTAATAQAAQPAPAQPEAPIGDQATQLGDATQEPPQEQAPPEQPTNTPEPPTPEAAAEVVISTNMNVRGGPGTGYNIVGAANSGERFPITGKNDAGDWWQIDFRGQAGWVFGQLVAAQNTGGVAIAQNIPAPPPPTPVPPTQPPPPPAEPAQPEQPSEPAPAPSQDYEFNKAVLQRCDPNEGVTYVNGTTYRNGQPTNGLLVAFSYDPNAAPVAVVQSGPHQGYEGWNTGFYSHILSTDGPREGNWFFWIVDSAGNRISAVGNVQTNGEAGDGKCQQAIIDFDS